MKKENFGIGLEIEGFIKENGYGKEIIDGLPASEWTLKQVEEKIPNLYPYLSFEQASVMLEVKSDVFEKDGEAVTQILNIREEINKILKEKGCELVFQPVLEKDFDFVPATSDPNSRSQELIQKWGNTEKGRKLLKDTVTASLQINDSRPFQNTDNLDEKLELAFQIHNLYSRNFDQLNKFNGKIRDFEGESRIEKAMRLLQEVKRDLFLKRGIKNPLEAILPSEFKNIEEMKNWMKAHSDVDNFEDAQCKNEHALTVKIKRNNDIWICESRVFDAVDTEKEIYAIIESNNQLLKQLNI